MKFQTQELLNDNEIFQNWLLNIMVKMHIKSCHVLSERWSLGKRQMSFRNVEFKSKFSSVFVFNLLSSKFQHSLYSCSCSNIRIWKWRNIASSSKFELQLQQHWEWNERRHGSTEECRLTYGEFWIGKTVWIMWCTRSFGHDYWVRHSHFHFCGRFRTVIMNCHDFSSQNASFTSIFFVILSRLCGDSSFAL